jgi:hypothetical protein
MQVADPLVIPRLDPFETVFRRQFIEDTAHPRQRVRESAVGIEDDQAILHDQMYDFFPELHG